MHFKAYCHSFSEYLHQLTFRRLLQFAAILFCSSPLYTPSVPRFKASKKRKKFSLSVTAAFGWVLLGFRLDPGFMYYHQY